MKNVGYTSNHTQVKVSVDSQTATSFKKVCEVRNISMASAISHFMEQFTGVTSKKPAYSPDLSTRRQRRAAVISIIRLLECIRDNENQYQENIPVNLQGGAAFGSAEECVSILGEAIDLLRSAY